MKSYIKILFFVVVPVFISFLYFNPVKADTPPADCSSVVLSETSKFVGAPQANWNVTVTTPDPDCAWSAVSDSSWLVVRSTTPSPAVGSGSVRLRAVDNTGAARTGHVTIGGQVYTVDQEAVSACPSVTLSETYMYVGAPEANWNVTVTTPNPACSWTASSDSSWLQVVSTTPDPAVGSGSVQLRSIDNITASARTGHVTIDGVVYTVDQEAGPYCPTGRSAVIVSGTRGSGASFTTNAAGTQTTVIFQLTPGCVDKTVSLLTWRKDGLPSSKYPQTLLNTVSGVFSSDGADHTLTIDISPCQMQTDLVFGSFADTTLTAVNDHTLGLQVPDWIFNDTICASAPTTATITVTKVVVNDDTGTSVVADFPLMVGTTVVVSGTAQTMAPGTYQVTESGSLSGYVGTFSGDCDVSGNITLAAGDNKTCTLTNNDVAPVVSASSSGGGGGGGGASGIFLPVVTAAPAVVLAPVPTPTPAPTGAVLGVSIPEDTSSDVGGEQLALDTTPVGGVAAGSGGVGQVVFPIALILLGIVGLASVKFQRNRTSI